jgi:hypothetical protein
MSFDGNTEADNIVERLLPLAGGNVFEGVTDESVIPRDANGKVQPYIDIKFTTPVASASGRGLLGEETQPHVFNMTIVAYAGDAATARRTITGGVLKSLVGWNPNPGNSTPLKSLGGYNATVMDGTGAPSRFEQGAFLEATINLATD